MNSYFEKGRASINTTPPGKASAGELGYPGWYEENYSFDGPAGCHVHKVTGERTSTPYEQYLVACNNAPAQQH